MKIRLAFLICVQSLAAALFTEAASPLSPEVPYPDGYRKWTHLSSVVTLPKTSAGTHPESEKVNEPAGVIHHIYANDQALEGFRDGHFPAGAVVIADWFFLEKKGANLVEGPHKSMNVMIRDERYTETGGWGFEDFDKDSHTTRNVGPNAVHACFECHQHAAGHEYIFGTYKP